MSLKLKYLEIKGLKCYENSGIIPFHDLTVFIGENDAGKSTILDALEYFLSNKTIPLELYRDNVDTAEIEITCTFFASTEIEDLNNYIINEELKIRKIFTKTALFRTEILAKVYVDNDLNVYEDMKASDLKDLLVKLGIEEKSNQALRKAAVKSYLEEHDIETEKIFTEVEWKKISNYVPIFQRYASSDYGTPTSLIRKTLELVYRESFYEKDAEGNEKLKDDFVKLQTDIESSLDTKLETQLLTHIQRYKPEIEKIRGNYDIDFSRGLSFSGLNIKDNSGMSVMLDQMGDGSKKKIFLSILEWDSEINMETDSTRNVIRAYDEPDAHLHYHAQREMFYIIKNLSEKDGSKIQSIICTHALTMIDRAPAKCINHVIKDGNSSAVSFLSGEEDDEILDFLNEISEVSGFKNSNIFYEKCFLLVEGEGEENALPIMYKKCKGRTLYEDGVVLINLQTNGQWSNALKFLNANKKDCTVLFLDSDTQYETSNSRVTKDKLNELGFDELFIENNCFFIGTKEFEDVFSDKQYAEICNSKFSKNDGSWSENDFSEIRSCTKFSEELKKLLSKECRRRIGKPEISLEIAKFLSPEEIEKILPIKNLFDKIEEIIG